MVINTHIFIQTIAIAVFFGLLEVFLIVIKKNERDEKAINSILNNKSGEDSLTRWKLFKRKLKNFTVYKKYKKWLDNYLELAFETKETSDNIIRSQQIIALSGTIMSILAGLVITPLFGLAVFILTALFTVYPAYSYYDIVTKKNKEFDRMLPGFINQTIMVLKVGVSMENSFSYGLQSMDNNLARKEFEKLVAEMSIHPDDIAGIFRNMNARVQTEECERFCNIVVSGLKNGNRMTDILKSEHERMIDNQLTRMQTEAESKKTLGTVLNILFIFLPAALLLIIPMLNMSTFG